MASTRKTQRMRRRLRGMQVSATEPLPSNVKLRDSGVPLNLGRTALKDEVPPSPWLALGCCSIFVIAFFNVNGACLRLFLGGLPRAN